MKNNRFLWGGAFVVIAILAYLGFQNKPSVPLGEQNIFGKSGSSLTAFQKNIVKKFREGNVPGLIEYFDEEVSITLFDEDDYYTKEEAENILLQFCQEHVSKKFLVKHNGANKNNSKFFLIAELTDTANEKFRIFISNNKTKIEDIRITIPEDI